ncbi:hypothetical protein, partial [Achromobacter marplatensis]
CSGQILPDYLELEVLVVLRHVKTPEGWIYVQLSGVSSLATGFLFGLPLYCAFLSLCTGTNAPALATIGTP